MNPLVASNSLRTALQTTSRLSTQLSKVADEISRIAKVSLKVIVPVLRLISLIRVLTSIKAGPSLSLRDKISQGLALITQKLRGLSKITFAPIISFKDKVTNGIKSIKDKYLNLDTLINGGKWLFNATLGTAMKQNPDSGASTSWGAIGNSVKNIKSNLKDAFAKMGTENLGKLEGFFKRIQVYAQKLEKFTGGAGFQKFADAGAIALGKILDAGIKVFSFVEKLGKWLQKNKEIVIPILSGIAAAAIVFGVILPIITAIQGAIAILIPIIAAVGWPILAVVAAVAAVIAIWRNWDTIAQAFTNIKERLLNTITELIASVKARFNDLILAAINLGKGIINNIVNGIKSAPGALLKAFKTVLPPFVVNTLERAGFSFGEDKGKNPKGNALGLAYVPYDNYPSMLHRGEQVLTRAEADNYRRGNGGVSIAKLADTLVVREDADINRIANAIAAKLKGAQVNYGGVVA